MTLSEHIFIAVWNVTILTCRHIQIYQKLEIQHFLATLFFHNSGDRYQMSKVINVCHILILCPLVHIITIVKAENFSVVHGFTVNHSEVIEPWLCISMTQVSIYSEGAVISF